mgnify:FL=1|tara:strand:- start:869 stop:979 length:111 start_codon:yes stop_codon:yes gene_type:complete
MIIFGDRQIIFGKCLMDFDEPFDEPKISVNQSLMNL